MKLRSRHQSCPNGPYDAGVLQSLKGQPDRGARQSGVSEPLPRDWPRLSPRRVGWDLPLGPRNSDREEQYEGEDRAVLASQNSRTLVGEASDDLIVISG